MRHVVADDRESIEVPLRAVVRDAIVFDAVAVIMAHNHPSGDPTPSGDDIIATQRVTHALDALGVRLIDHLVLAETGYVSMREKSLL